MKLGKLEKRILADLFKSNEGLFIFTLYQRYNFSPKEIYLAVTGLKTNGLIESDDERITITRAGINYAINSNMRTTNNTNKYERIPEEFLGPKIGINQFYIPKITKLTNKS